MKKEGWKLGLALVAVAALFVAGSIIVRPFPWLKANEYNIIGSLKVAGKDFVFSDDNPLVIDNVRLIKGYALANDGSKIYFDGQGGAEMEIDQIGFLHGRLYSSDLGIIDIGLNNNRIAKIDLAGNLSADFLLDNGKNILLSGKTSWRPYELNKVSVPEKLDLGVNSTVRIDPVVLGLAGRDLYDVQTKWSSSDENISVDEYGYVTAKKPGVYEGAVIFQVGETKKAITLAATQGIDKISIKPSVVLAPSGAQNFDLTFDPVIKGEEIRGASGITITGTFVNSANKRVTCGSYDKNFNQLKDCIFAQAEDAGVWNLEFVIDEGGQQGKYVFPSVLTVVKKDSALNMSLLANVYNGKTTTAEADINPENIIKLEPESAGGPWYKYLRYKAVINWPGYLLPKDAQKGKIDSGVLNISFKGQGVSVSGADSCNVSDGIPSSFSVAVVSQDIAADSLMIDIPELVSDAVEMNALLVQGCDFVATLDATFNVTLPDGTVMSGIKGGAEVRTAVAGRKRVSITGDVLVEQGDLQIKRLDEDQNLYLLVASEDVKASGGQGTVGSVSDYQLGEDSTYNKMINTLRDKVNKLVIERGVQPAFDPSSTGSVGVLQSFTLEQKQKNPEGRILVANAAGGEVRINNFDVGGLQICAPTTLVVYGRDVVIEDDIIMNTGGNSTCVERGNFGLIVFDGNISFAGDNGPNGAVEKVEGFYFTTGTISTGASHKKFSLQGVAFAHDYILERF